MEKQEKKLIDVRSLQRCYKTEDVETMALQEASFTIEQGEFLAIMGPSGSGKSTLMHIVGFLDKPTKGEYFFKGKNTTALEEEELAGLRNKEIGFVFQSFNLLTRTTVFDNVRLPLVYGKLSNAEHKVKTNKAIKAVSLEHRKDHFSNQLSGGEKQRVAIARALVNDPDVILADEPTGNLDSKTGASIMKILQDLNKQGKTIIMVTHEQDVADAAKRIIFMRDGLISTDKQVKNRHIFKDGDDLAK